jgi:CubicO group peptidase (beta-lactamase class C family)
MMAGLPWQSDTGLDPSALPTVAVAGRRGAGQPLAAAPRALLDLPLVGADGRSTTVAAVLQESETDAWVVLHAGAVVAERYRPGAGPDDLRPLMSISKSVVGAVAGVLLGSDALRADLPVSAWVPELPAAGYGSATVRQLLDMTSGVRFREDYTDPTSHIRAMDAAIAAGPGLHAYLAELVCERPHGTGFAYRSSETDVLAWACERAAGRPIADLVSDLLWAPMGAERDAAFLTDRVGTAVADGGLLATARDVARFGELILTGGSVAGRQVVPLPFLSEIWRVDPELRASFAASAAGPFLPGGWYRNQCWVMPGPHGDVLLGLGIHGQLLRVDPATRTVMVKLSSWRSPQDPYRLHDTLRACDAVAAALSGRPPRSGPRFAPAAGSPGGGSVAGR